MIPKFRAWQIENSEICEVTAIDYNGQRFGFGRQLNQEHFNEPDYWLRIDECILMQATGTHDKNGVEVFEIDIVEINMQSIIDNSTKKQLCSVIFNDGCFMLKPLSKIELPWVADSRISMNSDVCIVGNLYENPELLEQQNG